MFTALLSPLWRQGGGVRLSPNSSLSPGLPPRIPTELCPVTRHLHCPSLSDDIFLPQRAWLKGGR